MKKLRGVLGTSALLFASVAGAQVKDMPGGPRVNQLNLPEGVTQIASDIVWLHWMMLIICTVIFIGVFGVMFYSIIRHRKSAGFKPSKEVKEGPFSVVSETETLRAWRDVWSAGHGVGDVRAAEPAAAIVTRLREEYAAAAGPAKVCQGLVPAEDEMTP